MTGNTSSVPHDLLFMRTDIRLGLLDLGLEYRFLGYELSTVARGVSVGSMRDHFGAGAGAMWLLLAETPPEDLYRLVHNGFDLSLRAPQGQRVNSDGAVGCKRKCIWGVAVLL